MDILFYKLQDKVNDVKKTKTLTASTGYPLTISGTLRSATSKVAPSIDFAQSIEYFNDYNYCYIADFKRYYFVDDIISVRNNLTTVLLKVDVLTSFLTQASASSLSGYVIRCGNPAHYSNAIDDDLLQFKLKPTIIENVPYRLTQNDIDTSFKVSVNIETSGGTTTFSNPINIVVTTMAITPTGTDTNIDIPNSLKDFYNYYTGFQKIFPNVLRVDSGECIHICDRTGAGHIVDLCVDNDTIKSYVKNILAYPFNILDSGSGKTFYYKNTSEVFQTGIVEAKNNPYTKFMCVDDFFVTLPTSMDNYSYTFMLTNKYLTIEYYIPYYGWVTLDASSVINHRLKLYYIADLRTGKALINLVDVTDNKMIVSTNCQLGVKLALDSTNAYEVARKDEANTTSYVLSLLGSVGMATVGAFTYNPALVAGGAAGVLGSAGAAINKNATNIEYAQANLGGDVTSLVSQQKPKIRYTLREPILPKSDLTNFRTHFGYPTHKELTFNELSYQMSSTQYVQITDLHTAELTSYLTDITYSETKELETLCSQGIFY